MSRINPLNRQDVPELEPFLSSTEKRMGFVPNSQLVMAYKPKLLQAFSQLGQAVHDPANKTPRQLRMLVAHMASKSAGCQYCVAHTGESAHNANVEDQKIAAVGQYETSPFFTEAERAALRFAQRAAAVPNAVTDEDFAALRKHYSDEEIVELVSHDQLRVRDEAHSFFGSREERFKFRNVLTVKRIDARHRFPPFAQSGPESSS